MEARDQTAAGATETDAGARIGDCRGTLAASGGSLRRVALPWRDPGRSLSRRPRGVERKRIASKGTSARGASVAARADSSRNKLEEQYDRRPFAGPALRRADVIEGAQHHANCRPHADARHWGEHGDLQRRVCAAVAPA